MSENGQAGAGSNGKFWPGAEPGFEPGKKSESSAKRLGKLLSHELAVNPHFYLFSPDETTSNKLDAVFENSTRAWSDLGIESWDLPESANGRIIELLSENTLFATMVGHLLAGEPAMMTSYEAFFPIITSQITQHMKFLAQSEQVHWRPKYPSVNLLSTSTCWRQDHNGYSHQAPGLITQLIETPSRVFGQSAAGRSDASDARESGVRAGGRANCIFPLDANDMPGVFRYLMTSENAVNLVTFNKTDEPVWTEEVGTANAELPPARVLGFVSDGDSKNLDSHMNDIIDLVLVGCGDIATREVIYAAKILKASLPKLRIRVVNILALTHRGIGTGENVMTQKEFEKMFKVTTPLVTNFHGYPDVLRHILEEYSDRRRISVHGYEEYGSTTTPFEMLAMNHASRYDIAADAAERLGQPGLAAKYREILKANHAYAVYHGVDHKAIAEFRWV